MSPTVNLPIPPPPSAQIAAPLTQPPLNEDQLKMQAAVQAHFEDPSYLLAGIESTDKTLMDVEKMWLSYECILRYLRASKWKTEIAVRRLEETLLWRREYGVYDTVTADLVAPEATTGKQILLGFDVHGRPGMYLLPSRQNTNESPRQIQFVVWMLERCIELMPAGVESLDLLINYADKAKNPSFSTSKSVLNILQTHYPERLGLALIINVPFLLNAFYKMIKPFIDPLTATKLAFNPKLFEDKIFTEDVVMSEGWGGSYNFEYVHEKYWPALVAMCEERKKLWTETWVKLGGKVGIKEVDYKADVPADNVETGGEV
ncbi:unnamed protein product [Mycena citricolor]|uniref:CRAL-TRIO domain-containing protein n=1 Tax=Mycena citricolor TaxID=2018698 RepID=A0AAD2H2V1_9AGAR|nr:unnamed protein product [Mycena citricolor]